VRGNVGVLESALAFVHLAPGRRANPVRAQVRGA
jgi:hypothetical protein